jgi:hypothetical protein
MVNASLLRASPHFALDYASGHRQRLKYLPGRYDYPGHQHRGKHEPT